MRPIPAIFLTVIIALSVSPIANADQQIIMEIEGMTCKLWPLAIKKSLSATEGVKKVEISYEQAKAWITVTESTANQALTDAVANAGPFKGRVIARKATQ